MVFYHGRGGTEFYLPKDIGRQDGQSLVEIEKVPMTYCPKCHRPLGISTDADEPYLSCRHQDCDNIETYPLGD